MNTSHTPWFVVLDTRSGLTYWLRDDGYTPTLPAHERIVGRELTPDCTSGWDPQ